MPKKVLPTPEVFKEIEEYLLRHGFKSPQPGDLLKERIYRLVPPRRIDGCETPFVFKDNGLEAWIWTSWLKSENRARENDPAWAIIVQNDTLHYAREPIKRTAKFKERLMNWAWIIWRRVKGRPGCSECGLFMEISYRHGVIGARFWRCNNLRRHTSGKAVCLDWDFNMPPKAKKMLEMRRKAKEKYRKKRRAQGKDPFAARKNRKKWIKVNK
ncbi:MAG: hypothetical protein AAB792_00400 [Patescibacteria group bacterium]